MALTSGSEGRAAVRIGDAWFRTLAESTTTAIFVYDQERFYYVNRATEALTGLTADELFSICPIDLVHPDHRAEVEGRIARRLRGDEGAGRYEVKLVTGRGELWVEASADAVQLNGRRVSLGTAVDVTDRRRAREARERETERRRWIERIHEAFEEKRFCLYGQPIVPLRAEASGPPMVELLLRMRDGNGGVALPGAFIPAAERYRLIRSIDRWVVAEALTALAGRLGRGFAADTRFCINVSGQSMDDETFLDHVLSGFEASGVDPGRICFEVTETAAVGNLARARRFIAALKRLGVSFVLDDFGSGLSSFAYLKNLEVDYLKIAGDFVSGLAGGQVEQALVSAIHQVGSAMRIRTIAEGVESEAALAVLREIGIDYAQGFLLGEPGPLAGGGR